MNKKVTKHTIKNVFERTWEFISKFPVAVRPKIRGIIFSNKGAQGREALFDVSYSGTGDIMAYWKDEHQGIIDISATEPGYEIKMPKDMGGFFSDNLCLVDNLEFLDVSHANVSKTACFYRCFCGFGSKKKQDIYGLETWDVSNGDYFDLMFGGCFQYSRKNIDLDLSNWKFNKTGPCNISLMGMFSEFAQNTENVTLDLTGWDLEKAYRMQNMFFKFGEESNCIDLKGVEMWNVPKEKCHYNCMFEKFALKSAACLNLQEWSRNVPLQGPHEDFAKETFFQIQEPKWAN